MSDGLTKLISEEYINSTTPLLLQCGICGKVFSRDYDHIKRGRVWCQECAYKIASDEQKLSLGYVKQVIVEHGCEYISGEYINSESKLTIKCACGNIFQKSFHKFMSGQDRCP